MSANRIVIWALVVVVAVVTVSWVIVFVTGNLTPEGNAVMAMVFGALSTMAARSVPSVAGGGQ